MTESWQTCLTKLCGVEKRNLNEVKKYLGDECVLCCNRVTISQMSASITQ